MAEQLSLWAWVESGSPGADPACALFGPRHGAPAAPKARPVLAPPSRARELEEKVAAGVGLPVRLVVTDNRHTLVSWRPIPGGRAGYVVRVHHMFLEAPEAVALSLGRYVAGGRRDDGRVLDAYMERHQGLVTRERRPLAPPRGRFHDLARLQAHLNRAEFDGRLQARIGWGEPGMPRRRRRTTMQLGSFDALAGTIAVHPALDQAFVPEFFVTAVVFHEMLHEAVPATRVGDRRYVHTRDFRSREAAFPLTAPARAWERANLDGLMAFEPPQAPREPDRWVPAAPGHGQSVSAS